MQISYNADDHLYANLFFLCSDYLMRNLILKLYNGVSDIFFDNFFLDLKKNYFICLLHFSVSNL